MANKFTEKHKAVLVKTLKKYGNPEGIQNIYELEGFLVGALCCPDAVELDQMLFVIFGPEEDTYPKWGNQSEVESFFDSLFSLQNKNNALVHGASYKPKLLKDKKDHKKWCRGFVKGFGLKGFELADERFKEDSDIHDFMIFLCIITSSNLSEMFPENSTEQNDKLLLATTDVTTKVIGESVQYLFSRLHQDCCSGDHHHHHYNHTDNIYEGNFGVSETLH